MKVGARQLINWFDLRSILINLISFQQLIKMTEDIQSICLISGNQN